MNQNFTLRMQQILRILLQSNQIVPVQSLADQMKVSKRTIQRELEYLGRPLKKYGILFCSRTGAGVWLEGEPQKKQELLLLLNEVKGVDAADRTDRRKRLLLEILRDKTLKKLYYYSNLFGVSRATISSDLEILEDWLAVYQLSIIRMPGLGVTLAGSEADFRRALRAFIDENIDTDIIREYYDDRNDALYRLLDHQADNNIYSVLDREMLRRVIVCITRNKDPRIDNLTENSYIGLILHITIAINRMLSQEMIEDNPGLLSQMSQDEDYDLAKDIVNRLELEFQIQIPDVEIAYIGLHIKGTKVQQYDLTGRERATESGELLHLVNEMIDRFDKDLSYALKQDSEFVIAGLIAHLKPTLIRLENHMNIQNPLLEHIKTEYGDIFEKCQQVAQVIEEYYGYQVPEAEVGFIAIHFGAALVRLEESKASRRKVLIGVVCASGIGISRLMLSKIRRQLMGRAEVRAYGSYELTPLLLEKLDFIVSTMPLKEDGEVLYVGPLLNHAEMEAIEERVRHYERTPRKKAEENEFTRQLEQVNFIAGQIKHIIKEMGYLKTGVRISFDDLLVEIAAVLTPYQDLAGMIVEDIKRREKISSQVFQELGFALLHSRSRGVSKPVFLVCLPEDGGSFLDACFQGISLVLVMLIPEDEHIGDNSAVMGYLSEMLIEEGEFLETLRGGEKEAIRESLTKYLKQFFNQYLENM